MLKRRARNSPATRPSADMQPSASSYSGTMVLSLAYGAAGFDLVERSELNANPGDTKHHAKGVWALPPTLTNSEIDRETYLAIGKSDRMMHRYVKRG